MFLRKTTSDMSSKRTPQQARERRVAFLSLIPHIGALPAVVSGVNRLVQRGYEVDVISIRGADHIPKPRFPEERVNVYFLPHGRKLGIVPGILVILVRATQLLSEHGRYACFFGVDQRGMIVAAIAGLLLRTPVIYFSMELYMSNELRGLRQRMYKALERICNQRTWLTLMQDSERAACLVEDNRISQSQIMIVPNSPLGRAARKRGSYFNQRFGISEDRKIIFYAGNIIDWAMCLELAESALTWPDKWALVLHGYVVSAQEEYFGKIERLATDSRVVISLDMVPYEDLERLYSSADIGVALYDSEKGANYANIAGASGKLIRYLKCGLPIVTSDSPGLRRLIDQHQCGIYVRNEHEIRSAIAHLLANYDEFSLNAIKCYDEEFDFARHFDRVIARIDKLQ
jgi:glycosyltransferase involved in cell wall biosynthesis